jgi:glycosyltransferase involved in cell wall biosynthesis
VSEREPGGSLEVVQFQRRAGPTSFSVERLFDDVRASLPPDIRVRLRINDFMSRGTLARAWDALSAWRVRGRVNHVLGDVHYVGWLLPRRRTVLTVLDCVSLDRLSGPRRWLFWLLWYWWPVRRAAHVTVISEFSAAALRKHLRIDPGRLHVIHPPLSPEFRAAAPNRPGRKPVLLQVGTVANKNLERVVLAISGLPVRLLVVGALDDRQRAMLASHRIDVDQRENLDREGLAACYRSADVLVFASTYEGFGLPIIEAQATGRPVVTSDAGAMPEAAGGAACLVDPMDVADIRRGIQRVIGDPAYAAALVRAGFENAARYEAGRIAGEYAALYRRVARDADGGADGAGAATSAPVPGAAPADAAGQGQPHRRAGNR